MTSRHASEGFSPAALAQTAPLVDLWGRNGLKGMRREKPGPRAKNRRKTGARPSIFLLGIGILQFWHE